MKRLSVWMLAIALVLGIGFAALAEEAEVLGDVGVEWCWPPTPPPPAECEGNLPKTETMDVTLHVVPWAEISLNDMDISFCRPGTFLNGQVWVPVSGGTNTKIKLGIHSTGFDDPKANDWITYGVHGLSFLPRVFRPGKQAWPSISREPGKWNGQVSASGYWQTILKDWTSYTAGTYEDTLVFTVEAR
ncbi:MAG: hypothetical protein GX322_06815 [Firmicutes bacterium]|nr:hypothetical protein [Bacillota bacterium]